jgi:hypothetical protein
MHSTKEARETLEDANVSGVRQRERKETGADEKEGA